jgi:hydrogenase-4 membrane subunit HyfE
MKKGKGNYVFPNILATIMKGVSQRVQYEAEMLAIVFILLGIVFMGIYTTFFTQLPPVVKIFTGVNVAAGFVFLSSRLVTSFQQYQSYLQAIGIIEDYNALEAQLN